jgi:hypothetical protein
MSGGPSQVDLWDYKPNLAALYDKDIPDSVRGAQQLTGMTAGQARFPVAPSHWAFKRYGETGTWVSELLPYTGAHGRRPGHHQVNQHRRHQSRAGHHAHEYRQHERRQAVPRLVAGLWPGQHERQSAHVHGAANQAEHEGEQPARLVAPVEQRVSFFGICRRGTALGGDPVLYFTDPDGVDREVRRKMLDAVNEINRQTYEELGDPETNARIAQYEMAYRMQTSVPELADLSKEPKSTWDLYGPEAKEPGTFAYNCLMARRLAERGVRFTQVYKRGWDMHDNVTGICPSSAGDRSRLLCAGHRPQAARPARRHAGRLGGRVRPHRL